MLQFTGSTVRTVFTANWWCGKVE